MNDIGIDKGIPVPSHKTGKKPKYPVRTMEIGDSFFAADVTNSGVMNSIKGYKTRFRFTARTVTENGVKGVRVWRIE